MTKNKAAKISRVRETQERNIDERHLTELRRPRSTVACQPAVGKAGGRYATISL